jgi:hypothetical protein
MRVGRAFRATLPFESTFSLARIVQHLTCDADWMNCTFEIAIPDKIADQDECVRELEDH